MLLALAGSLTMLLASTDLEPERLYYQVDRPMPMSISDHDASASYEIALLTPSNEEVARAQIPSGGTGNVDLAALFDGLYGYTTVHYAQLLENDTPVGSSLVLSPLVERPYPVIQQSQRGPQVRQWQQVPENMKMMAGFRVYPERYATLHTTAGDITIALRPDMAPNTCWNFRHLVEGGFYTHIPFHRIIGTTRPGPGFVIQAGDPTGTGSGGPGYSIDLEASTLPHDLGVISMAREGRDIHTGGSQFFLCLSREATAGLDVQYTSFGQTIEGIDVIKQLGGVKTGPGDRPIEMPYINTAELVPAKPRTPGEKPSWISSGPSTAGSGAQESSPANPER